MIQVGTIIHCVHFERIFEKRRLFSSNVMSLKFPARKYVLLWFWYNLHWFWYNIIFTKLTEAITQSLLWTRQPRIISTEGMENNFWLGIGSEVTAPPWKPLLPRLQYHPKHSIIQKSFKLNFTNLPQPDMSEIVTKCLVGQRLFVFVLCVYLR